MPAAACRFPGMPGIPVVLVLVLVLVVVVGAPVVVEVLLVVVVGAPVVLDVLDVEVEVGPTARKPPAVSRNRKGAVIRAASYLYQQFARTSLAEQLPVSLSPAPVVMRRARPREKAAPTPPIGTLAPPSGGT